MTNRTISASTLIGDDVVNPAGEDIGKIEELVIDCTTGDVAYAVLSFGGFLGIGDKFFAVPWQVLAVDFDEERVVMDVPKSRLENAEGFDKDEWPDFADPTFRKRIYSYYQVEVGV